MQNIFRKSLQFQSQIQKLKQIPLIQPSLYPIKLHHQQNYFIKQEQTKPENLTTNTEEFSQPNINIKQPTTEEKIKNFSEKAEKLQENPWVKRALILSFAGMVFLEIVKFLDAKATQEQMEAELEPLGDQIKKEEENPKQSQILTDLYAKKCATLLKYKDPREALEAIELALKRKKNDPELYFLKGKCLFDLHKYDEVLDVCEPAIKLNPRFTDVYILRGFAYIKQNKPALAITQYEQSVEFDILNEYAYLMSAKAHLKLENYQESIKQCDMCLMINPKSKKAFATKQKAVNRYSQEIFKKGREQRKEDPTYQHQHLLAYIPLESGLDLMTAGIPDKALKYIQKVEEYDKNMMEYFFVKAQIYDYKEEYETALEQIELAIQTEVEDSKIQLLKASILARLGQFQNARQIIKSGNKTHPIQTQFIESHINQIEKDFEKAK